MRGAAVVWGRLRNKCEAGQIRPYVQSKQATPTFAPVHLGPGEKSLEISS